MKCWQASLVAPAAIAVAVVGTSGVRVDRTAYLMGTRVNLVTWEATREEGLVRLERALGELEAADAELSTWRRDSAITALNQTEVGKPWSGPPALCGLLATLFDWQEATRGTFDPAIGRLLEAWAVHEGGRVPTPGELSRARALSGLSHFEINRVNCGVTRRADATLDVGAFGKGEALDRAARAMGGGAWMIDLGGQVSVAGAPPGAASWAVAIAHPLERGRPFLSIGMHGGSLSTSAGSERDHAVNGQRIGHILDPRSGTPAPFRGSVSVWHPRGLIADILSTALYVMGPEEGVGWAEARDIAACYLVPDGQGRVEAAMTTAFQRSVLFSEQ